jgi:type III restriction enzyme
MPLKEYQQESLDRLGEYCQAICRATARGESKPARAAFEQITERSYHFAPNFEQVPYVCLRLPTGGGKTLLAAHALGTIADKLLGQEHPACLWITPGTVIRDQTLRALRHPTHPYRLALQDALHSQVEIVTMEEALTRPQTMQSPTALVIVTTIQSYRLRDDRTGQELADTRRIYRDNGYLQMIFDKLPRWAQAELSKDERGLVDLSLANAIRLRSPIVIIDEAHNARTQNSFDSLARFGPSFVLELTATPERTHDPQHPKNPRFASNVLHAVGALELKDAGMIKLPVDLESRGDWLEVLAATVQRRNELEKIADHATQDVGLPFIRPIALIQAQPNSKTRDTHTVDDVRKALEERLDVPPEEIRICTGSLDEIGDENLMAETCRVRYVITVDKLREGWDCPLAYVLGSIGNTATATAVEQLIGRILRMPFATPTRVPALDRAYAFVLSDDVVKTARELADRLVETCGFDAQSVNDALRVTSTQGQPLLGFGQIPLSEPVADGSLPKSLRGKAHYDQGASSLVFEVPPTREELQSIRDTVVGEQDRSAVEAFWESNRPSGIAVKPLDGYADPFCIPRLGVKRQQGWTLLEPSELDEFAWNLDACGIAIRESEFATDVRVGEAATIDVEPAPDGSSGGIFTAAAGFVRLKQLEIAGEGDDWTENELVLWLDRALHREERFCGLLLGESQGWIRRAVDYLLRTRELDLPAMVRRRSQLSDVLRMMVADHGRKQTRLATECLIDNRPEAFHVTNEFALLVEEQAYRPISQYTTNHHFQRHAFDSIGDMNGEEVDCATRIDKHPNVQRWIRNADRETQGGYWLPKSPGKFFPDFIVELKDGMRVLVEYKGRQLMNDPEELFKKYIGDLWERRSDGLCRFAWVADKDWMTLAAKLEE